MVIKRFSNMLGSKRGANPFSRSSPGSSDAVTEEAAVVHGGDTPEGSVARGVRLFCESGGPNTQGEEVLHLPTIVEGAESSPAAAAVAAQQIRKNLSKDNYGRPHVQYNAIMLIRILADNPGATFTRNLDQKFTSTVKELLRTGKDASVQQILRETLSALYMDKAYDTNLATLFTMWSKESGMNISQAARGSGAGQNGYGGGQQLGRHTSPQQGAFGEPRRGRETGLPTPVELAARIEEAKTSAKLLQQLVQSTPANELQGNDLITEFAERCQTAQRSMQGYMNATNPSPDDDTMQTLIETSEQLSLAASKHQRAVLQARRSGASNSPAQQGVFAPPAVPPPNVTSYPNPVSPPSSTFAPTVSHDLAAYSPPPVPPPSMRANLERRSTGEFGSPTYNPPSNAPPSTAAPSIPSSTAPFIPSSTAPQLPPIRPGATEIPAPQYDNPFSDTHESAHADIAAPVPRKKLSLEPISASSYDEDDDPYRPPSGHPTSSTMATLSMRPAPARGVESWRAPAPHGSPDSYHPGFQSTPSYMKRQESAGDKFTMHGAAIDEERVAESAGRYGRVGETGVSPVYERGHARTGSQGDVSPVDSRYGGGGRGDAASKNGYRY